MNTTFNFEFEPETKKARAAVEATKRTVRAWMRANGAEYEDPTTGEINATALAEAAADHFGVKDLNGPLDDPDHWIWDLAAEVAGL